MSLYSSLFGYALRLNNFLKGKSVYKLYNDLLKEQYLPKYKIEAFQLVRLNKLLAHAYEKSPYYKNLFQENNIAAVGKIDFDNLQNIPLLKREDLQNHLDEIKCPGLNLYKDSSGGSTGNPVNFYHDDNYILWSEVHNLLFLSWMGIKPGDKTAIFWGAARDLKDLSFGDKFYNNIYRIKQLNSFSMSDKNIMEFIDKLNSFKPEYIYGYVSSLFLASEFIINNNLSINKPRALRSSAEMLYDYQRTTIEKAFNTKVYNFYGSREVNNIASECSEHNGLHVFASGRIVEIVDDQGVAVPDGEIGMVAVTDLTNYAFPFIRYLNGDIASYKKSNDSCSCGRDYPILEKIIGRSSDIIVINGHYIHGEYFTHLFYNHPDIIQFQLIQEEDGSLSLLYISEREKLNIDDIVDKIKNKVGGNITLNLKRVDRIEPTASGKHRFTISKLATTYKKQ